MKLPIKKKYFDLIISGKKRFELRDAHLTFVCEETGEEFRADVVGVCLDYRKNFPSYEDVLKDKRIIVFDLGDGYV